MAHNKAITKVKIFTFSGDVVMEKTINDWLLLLQTNGQIIQSINVTSTEKQFMVMIVYSE